MDAAQNDTLRFNRSDTGHQFTAVLRRRSEDVLKGR